MQRKKLLSILLTLALTLGLLALAPITAHAATGMATIDVSTLGASNADNSGAAVFEALIAASGGTVRVPEARAFVMNIFTAVGGERLGRVILNKIEPGGRIYPHPDTPEHARYYSRFHLVLQSAEGVKFRSGDEWTYWETGSVFWFRNDLDHEVINESSIDRIHMVVDARCRR
jgi:hypothetical protein